MTTLPARAWAFAILLIANGVLAQDQNAFDAVSIAVRGPVQPVLANGKFVVVYEVDIFNRTKTGLPVQALEISDASVLRARYDKVDLEQNGRQFSPRASNLRIPLKAGARAIVFCWFEMPSQDQPPKILRHRLVYGARQSEPKVVEVTTSVVAPATLALGPPVPPGEWLAGNALSRKSEHRTAQIRIDGNPAAPFAQRYAIDWLGLCDNQLFRNKGKANGDYCSYGNPVIAVANGVVAAVQDGIPENKPGDRSRAIRMTKDTLLGNYVALDLGQQRYALYAHLQPGSVLVKVGTAVRRGQSLGRIGNTGNSDAPHLHFHVGRSASLDDLITGQTEPIPFVFEKFDRRGKYSGKGLFNDVEHDVRLLEIPLENDIVSFLP